jgi:hypothetical protein
MVDGPASEPADATPDAAVMLLPREKFVNSVVLCESASNKFLQHPAQSQSRSESESFAQTDYDYD